MATLAAKRPSSFEGKAMKRQRVILYGMMEGAVCILERILLQDCRAFSLVV